MAHPHTIRCLGDTVTGPCLDPACPVDVLRALVAEKAARERAEAELAWLRAKCISLGWPDDAVERAAGGPDAD